MAASRTAVAVWIAVLTLAAVVGAAIASGHGDWASSGTEPGPPAAGRVVVLELFTSEGCSSCPPADRLLARLAAEQEHDGKIVPLALHVDYWNYLGWRDPYSSSRWSERQERYARALSGRLYTPQLVIDGHSEAVGSKEHDVRTALRRALAVEPAGWVEVEVGEPGNGSLPVTLTAQLHPQRARRPADLMWVLFESDLSTSVPRGENAGRELHHDYVVRRLERAFRLSPGPGDSPRSETLTLTLDPAWDPAHLGVAAFLQDPKSLEILAAATGDQARNAR